MNVEMPIDMRTGVVSVLIVVLIRSGKHRGFAFVEYEEAEDAVAAQDNYNGAELYGRTVTVNLARPSAATSRASMFTNVDRSGFSYDDVDSLGCTAPDRRRSGKDRRPVRCSRATTNQCINIVSVSCC